MPSTCCNAQVVPLALLGQPKPQDLGFSFALQLQLYQLVLSEAVAVSSKRTGKLEVGENESFSLAFAITQELLAVAKF